MTIFLSYSSAQRDVASRIELSLESDGHVVFRDRPDLPPGDPYDARIREAIASSDLLIFLIAPESVAAGRYTHTELKLAEQKWGHPAGRVLPVLVAPTPLADIPAFLRAVTFLEPRGDVAAEVAAEVARLAARRVPAYRRYLVAGTVSVAAIVAVIVWWPSGRVADTATTPPVPAVAPFLAEADVERQAGRYAAAWDRLEAAAAASPTDALVVDAQERLAMEWLRNARGSQLTGKLGDIADKVSAVLTRGAARHDGQRSADLHAHLGWADFLRSRDGIGGLDPVQRYRRALDLEPRNVYAHAMWAFHLLTGRERDDAAAATHFKAALDAGRERDAVRTLQLSAHLWRRDPNHQNAAIAVADEMRRAGEPVPGLFADDSGRWRLWDIYYDRLVNGFERASFLDALPAVNHVATFQWLYPESGFVKGMHTYLFVLAQLQEHARDAAARDSYRRLLSILERDGVTTGSMIERARRGAAAR